MTPPLVAVPDAAAILRDPALADALPATAYAALYADIARAEAHMRAGMLARAVETTRPPASTSPASADDWIGLDEAAAIVRRSQTWLRRSRLPFVRRVSRKNILVSRSKLLRWIETRGPA